MGSFIDLTGKRFTRLTVLRRARKDDVYGKPLWDCSCKCGNRVTTRGWVLRNRVTLSCGCLQRERAKGHHCTHGQARAGHPTLKYKLYNGAKHRAKRDGLPFNLELSDIRIPKHCPVFPHIKLVSSKRVVRLNSPSLDKLIPRLGYVKGNVRVISYLANTIKQNATYKELFRVATWLKKEIANARATPKTGRVPRRNS